MAVTREACFSFTGNRAQPHIIIWIKRRNMSLTSLLIPVRAKATIRANNWHPKREKNISIKNVKTTVFNSGLWTIGPHCIASPSVNFPGIGELLFKKTKTKFGGWLCWKLLSTDKMNPEHLSIDSSDRLQM